ncbi:MAG: 6-phosphofructokinase [Flavobacteriales bacterium]|nr:6-phosphofructokinase [Flavobacteriales bacterium]
MKKIGVYTSGGDAPGMNACIRAVVRTAIANDISVVGIRRGYEGMIAGDMIDLDSRSVANILQRGGTFLKTARSEEFRTPEGRAKAMEQLRKRGIEALVCIGGNGSYAGALKLNEEHGIPCVGIPGTIDNDLYGTDFTIGYDTAVNTALDAIDRIRDTADSHDRVFLVEVMGRDSGFIGLDVGIAGGAEGIMIPEDKEDIGKLLTHFSQEDRRTKAFSIIVVAEGEPEGGAARLATRLLAEYPNLDIRTTILGHIQRGGSPTARDRILASRLGYEAIQALQKGLKNIAVGIINGYASYTSFEHAIHNKKSVSHELLRMAEVLSR